MKIGKKIKHNLSRPSRESLSIIIIIVARTNELPCTPLGRWGVRITDARVMQWLLCVCMCSRACFYKLITEVCGKRLYIKRPLHCDDNYYHYYHPSWFTITAVHYLCTTSRGARFARPLLHPNQQPPITYLHVALYIHFILAVYRHYYYNIIVS